MSIATLDDLNLGPVAWQGVQEHTTQRGRVKPVLVGIPGPVFWHHWRNPAPGFKERLREAMIAPQRVAKGQWQLTLWINRKNRHLVEGAGYSIPEVTTEEKPF